MRFPWSSTPRRRRRKPLLQVPFVGQQTILTGLASHLQAAQHGSAQGVLLSGPPGSGKSALLEEFVFRSCTAPGVLLLQLNASACLLDHEVYWQLCTAVQSRSEQIVQKVYTATQRVRKTLGLHWDAAEFRQVLASADWAQLPEAGASPRPPAVRASTPFGPLLASVQEYPWAIGAAALLGVMGRSVPGPTAQRLWLQRWVMFLRALRARYQPGAAALVLLIDQLPEPAGTPGGVTHAVDWQTWITATVAEQLPLLVLWAGTPEGIQPVQEAVGDVLPLTVYSIEPLADEAQQSFLRQAVRSLPRAQHTSWAQALGSAGAAARVPDWLLLATACAAASSEQAGGAAVSTLTQADMATLVGQLVEMLRQRSTVQAPLLRQLVEACAFLPPGQYCVLDDLLPLCDIAGLGFDPATGRAHLETLLAQWVHYGLLRYDPYTSRYTLGSSAVQEALQGLAYPDAQVRQQVAYQRRLSTAILYHVQQGEREGLTALAQHMETTYGGAARVLLTPLVVAPFRRLLPTCTKVERQRIAQTLGGFTSALAVDLVRLLVHDEDGQVRSSAVQSLAELTREEAFPVLLEALQDPNSDVRWIATRALGAMSGTTTAVDALIPMLTDDDKEVARIAAEGLGRHGDRRAVPHLIAALRESYPLLRESAILALGQLADQRAIPALQEVLQDANRQVRRSAERTLARFAASAGG